MFKRFKSWAKHWATCISFGVGLALVLSAAPAQAQTYVRPSKGAAVVIFDVASPVAGTYTSAVYDMSAFSEAQFDVDLYAGFIGAYHETYSVSQLGRYIKIVGKYDTQGSAGVSALTYTVYGADAPNSEFKPLSSPGSSQVIRPSGSQVATYGNVKLTMTPIPFNTIQYSRPSKGNTIVLIEDVWSNSAAPTFVPSSPVIDMRGFASLAVNVKLSGSSCKYNPIIEINGGSAAYTAVMDKLKTENSSAKLTESGFYVVNTPTSFVYAKLFAATEGTKSSTCSVAISLTPLPYESAPGAYATYKGSGSDYTLSAAGSASPTEVQLFNTLLHFRVQNVGAAPVICGSETYLPMFKLAAETAPGNGGVVSFEGYVGRLLCWTTGGSASTIYVFSH